MGNSRQFHERWTAVLVEVGTDTGLTGWGENTAAPFAVAAHVRNVLAPILLGQNGALPLPLYRRMQATLGYDKRGPAQMAIGAVDMALWDLAGKARSLPVSALLGGKVRSSITAYASGPFMTKGPDPYAEYEAEVERYLGDNFRAFKLRSGYRPREDAAAIARIRRLIGEDLPLMVDINQGYTIPAALELADRAAESRLMWMEEPLTPDDLPGYRRLAQTIDVPLAGGESLAGLAVYRDFLGERTFEVLQPDLSVCGGFTCGAQIAHLAEAHEVPVVPHIFGTAINFFASLQFAATLPDVRVRNGMAYPFFEYDPYHNPLRTLCGEWPVSGDGTVAVPDAPGIGVVPALEDLEPYVLDHWLGETD